MIISKIFLHPKLRISYLTFIIILIYIFLLSNLVSSQEVDTLWFEDFESGFGDWYTDGGLWQIVEFPFSPTTPDNHCAGIVLKSYFSGSIGSRLTRPPFMVSNSNTNPALKFWQWFDFKDTEGGQVQIKVGDNNWKVISNIFSGSSNSSWSLCYIPLDSFADSTVQIGFYFYTSNYWENYGGRIPWMIDNVEVCLVSTKIDEKKDAVNHIRSFRLEQNYPNPFNSTTDIEFFLPYSAQVVLKIYNLNGGEIATLIDDFFPMGHHKVNWIAQNLASGIYYYRIQAGNFTQTKKMLLIQ